MSRINKLYLSYQIQAQIQIQIKNAQAATLRSDSHGVMR